MQPFASALSSSTGTLRVRYLVALLVCWTLGLWAATSVHAQPASGTLAAIPAWRAPLTDSANVLDPAQAARIHYKLADFQAQRGVHPSVLIVQDTGAETLERYAARVAGRGVLDAEGQDDHMLLLVSVSQRAMHIATGRGLEARMPAAVALRIADERAKPLLNDDEYADGIDAALDALAVQFGGALAQRPEVAGTPWMFARDATAPPEQPDAGWFVALEMVGSAVLAALLGYAAYRWRAMRLCAAGLTVLAVAVAVTNLFGSDTLIYGVSSVAALLIGAFVLTITFDGMRRALARGLRDFSLRWLAVAGLTAVMAWQARGSLIPVAITALLAMLFAFMPARDKGRLSGSDDRDNGDLPEGW